MAADDATEAEKLGVRIDIRLGEIFDEWLEIAAVQTDSLNSEDDESYLSTVAAADFCSRRLERWLRLRSEKCPGVPVSLAVRRKWNELLFKLESNEPLLEVQTKEARRSYLAANVKRQMGQWLD